MDVQENVEEVAEELHPDDGRGSFKDELVSIGRHLDASGSARFETEATSAYNLYDVVLVGDHLNQADTKQDVIHKEDVVERVDEGPLVGQESKKTSFSDLVSVFVVLGDSGPTLRDKCLRCRPTSHRHHCRSLQVAPTVAGQQCC
eukprot:752987-Hanusia_phi.AAC.4